MPGSFLRASGRSVEQAVAGLGFQQQRLFARAPQPRPRLAIEGAQGVDLEFDIRCRGTVKFLAHFLTGG